MRSRFDRTIGPVVSVVRKAGGGIKQIFVRPDSSAQSSVPAVADRGEGADTSKAKPTKTKKKVKKPVPPKSDSMPIGLTGATSNSTGAVDTNTTKTNASTMSSIQATDGTTTKESTKSSETKSEKTSGGAGYHYFHDMANRGTAPKAQPKKLTDEEAAALSAKLEGSGGSGLSSWNTAGTWEERNHTKWAEERTKAMMVGHTVTHKSFTTKLTAIKTFKGDATVVVVRGKPRSGFDFDVTVGWESTFAGDGDDDSVKVKGTFHIPEASNDTVADDEVEYRVTVEDKKAELRSQEDLVYQYLRKELRQFFHQTFSTIDEELKKRAEGA